MRLSTKEFLERFPDHPAARRIAAEAQPVSGRQTGAQRRGKANRSSSGSSVLEELFAQQVRSLSAGAVAGVVREHRFHGQRQWRFDFAWPSELLAVEIEGGIWGQGRHNRAHGFIADAQKYNTAQAMGWRVLRFTGVQIRSGEAIALIRTMLDGSGTCDQPPEPYRPRPRKAGQSG